ncbi:MAG: nucleoside monophosphate kinase [Lentisphaeria bacterium]
MKSYVFLGPPGAGKGTLGAVFCKGMGVIHVSTGQLLRDEMAAKSDLGKEVKELIADGKLVSDEIVTAMVAKRLAKPDIQEHGCLLDGYPRTLAQAKDLDKILVDLNSELAATVLIEADRNLLLARLTSRRMCSNKKCGAIYNTRSLKPKKEGVCDKCGSKLYQRSDDSEETAMGRLKVYDKHTAPLIQYYEDEGKLIRTISEDGAVEDNYNYLLSLLEK